MKLTIYIPTYRRPDIKQCLASIVPQIVQGVEVIVSDNDPDGYAQNIVERFANVSYQRRMCNIGGDANILRGLTQGSGEYVWIVGDDDTVLPGTISALLPMLDGVDRILHWAPNSKEINPGFSGSLRDYILSLNDKSVLTASTLITASVWRRAAMDMSLGLARIDTRYPLAWASIEMRTIKVMPNPTITVGHEYTDNYFQYFPKVIDHYVRELSRVHGLPTLNYEQVCNWNFASISR